MIIIKPDLVIKWANSNLVLHRVREHLCVFLRFPASPYIFIFVNILGIVLESLNMHMHCVCDCVCQGKVLQRKGIYIRECLVRHGDCYHLPSGKKRRRKKTQTFPHPFSFSSLFSILHSVQLSPSLFLYHLQRQPFPPKWGHVRKVCKWNHCSWIRMGHHIP